MRTYASPNSTIAPTTLGKLFSMRRMGIQAAELWPEQRLESQLPRLRLCAQWKRYSSVRSICSTYCWHADESLRPVKRTEVRADSTLTHVCWTQPGCGWGVRAWSQVRTCVEQLKSTQTNTRTRSLWVWPQDREMPSLSNARSST